MMSQHLETTDALPSPPRDAENAHISNNEKKTTRNEPKISKQYRSDTESPPLGKSKNSRSKRKSRSGNTFVQVINSPWAHVGTISYYNIATHCEKRNHAKKENEMETKQTAAIKKNKKPVTDDDIDAVAVYLEAGWETTFTELGFDENQILKYKTQYSNDLEVKRALLKSWTRQNGKDNATVGVLAQVLWNTNQRGAVKFWSSTYDDN